MPFLRIDYGITGNYYAYSDMKLIIIDVCSKIGKSTSSIYFNRKYQNYCIRVKSKKHKKRLKKLHDEMGLTVLK